MKRYVVVPSLLLGVCIQAQTYTASDTLSVGTSANYYIMDSSAANYDAIGGKGVTWDYSDLFQYTSLFTAKDTVIQATASPKASQFPDAVYADVTEGVTSTFFTNQSDGVLNYGYVIDIEKNTIKVQHDRDPLLAIRFPMQQGDTYTDKIAGTLSISNLPTGDEGYRYEGSAIVTADGSGTLRIGDSAITNVLRIKSEELMSIKIFPFPPAVPLLLTRTVYTYYALGSQKAPLFVHTRVDLNTPVLKYNYSSVLSSVKSKDLLLNVNETISSEALSVYPNPANNSVHFDVPQHTDRISIMNVAGKEVHTILRPDPSVAVDVSDFPDGIYFVRIAKGEAILTKKLVVKK